MSTTLEVLLAIVGILGSAMIGAFTRARAWTLRQAFLRLAYNEPADIVVTTSDEVPVGAHRAIQQSAVSLGDLEGAAAFSDAIGDLRRKKTVKVHPSQEQSYTLDNDLVLLGGPRANHITQAFLRHVQWAHPELKIAFAEQSRDHCVVAVDELQLPYAPTSQRRTVKDTGQPPKDDYAIAVAWINPFTIRPRRAFLCAGFSSLGTAAAARYLLREVMPHRFRGLSSQRMFRGFLRLAVRPRAWRAGRRWRVWSPPCFLLILRFEFTGATDYEIQEVKYIPLRLPERHPLEAPLPAFTEALESDLVKRAIKRARKHDPAQISYKAFGQLVDDVSEKFPTHDPSALTGDLARRLRSSDIALFRDHLDRLGPIPSSEPDGSASPASGRPFLKKSERTSPRATMSGITWGRLVARGRKRHRT